jgi:hypothetical protein
MAKRQKGRDSVDDLVPELTGSVDLAYPEGGEHEQYYEPYTPLVGTPPNVTPQKKARKKNKTSLALDDKQIAENRARKRRYDQFISHLIKNGGDKAVALALTYGLPSDAVAEKFDDYMADVMLGMTTSGVGDLLEEAGIGKAARIGLLAQHVYNPDPKVSLVSLKLATDLDGDKHDHGATYEQYLRIVKGRQ